MKISVLSVIRRAAILLLLNLHTSSASIQVIDQSKVYQSRPDKYIGLQMRTGLEYPARLQHIHDDPYLCGNGQWNVTVPQDGLPGEF
jgi:hypothetical protein